MSENGKPILMLAVVLIAAFVIAIYLPPLFKSTPTMEVTNCELTSNTVQSSTQTSISFAIKNNDQNNAHTLTAKFSSHQNVEFLLGSKLLGQSVESTYTDTFNPSAEHSQIVNVKASLDYGVNSLSYNIYVDFYMDGNKFDSRTLVLTVKS